MSRRTFARVQQYVPECRVLIDNVEEHVQQAEAQMFPARLQEEEVWAQSVLESVLNTKVICSCFAVEHESGVFVFVCVCVCVCVYHHVVHTKASFCKCGYYTPLAVSQPAIYNGSYVTINKPPL